jgi:hypothetical protein
MFGRLAFTASLPLVAAHRGINRKGFVRPFDDHAANLSRSGALADGKIADVAARMIAGTQDPGGCRARRSISLRAVKKAEADQ